MVSLDDYIADLTSAECIEFCARRSGIPAASVRERLIDYAFEVRFGAKILSSLRFEGRRVLEVGAGLGLLGVWLKRCGVSITLLEPGAGGFGDNQRLLTAVLEWLDASDVPLLPIVAEDLDPARHGTFDVICSVNALEHIPHLERALTAMLTVLSPGGVMRHTCPNYAVPYDPHYGMPLIPWRPDLTASVLPSLARDEVWQSLNFITYGRVVRFCRTHRLRYRFDTGLLAEAFDRLDHDPAFRLRRGPIVRTGHRVLRAMRLLWLLAHLPPRWATPMAFTLWREEDGSVEKTG